MIAKAKDYYRQGIMIIEIAQLSQFYLYLIDMHKFNKLNYLQPCAKTQF
jgi:hypothetical protein